MLSSPPNAGYTTPSSTPDTSPVPSPRATRKPTARGLKPKVPPAPPVVPSATNMRLGASEDEEDADFQPPAALLKLVCDTFFASPYKNDARLSKAVELLVGAKSIGAILRHIDAIYNFMSHLQKTTQRSSEATAFRNALDQLGRFVATVDKQIADCPEPVNDTGVRFDDLAGMHQEIRELRSFFVYPTIFPGLFKSVQPRGGVLLYGPPGTGKTSLAKAAVSEFKSRVLFFSVTPGKIKSKYVGETDKNLERLFQCARQRLERDRELMVVLFFDEFEALAADRAGVDTSDAADSRTVPTLLQLMQGLEGSHKRLFVMAATNLISQIDKAILRRFPTQIFVDLPDHDARMQVLYTVLAEAYSIPGAIIEQVRVSREGGAKRPNVRIRYRYEGGEGAVYHTGPEFIDLLCIFGHEIERPSSTTLFERRGAWYDQLEQVVSYMGPRDGSVLVNKRKEKGGQSMVGYSASDIRNLLSRVINTDALRWVCVEDTTYRKDARFVEVRFRPYKGAEWTKESYYVATPRTHADIVEDASKFAHLVQVVSTELVGCEKLGHVAGYEPRMLSYSLQPSDIMHGFNLAPATLKTVEEYKIYTRHPKESHAA